MIFGFCMARISTLVLRIAWSTRHQNQGLAIAASILVNAGILIIYIINLLFAQRILRAENPRLGWNRILHFAYIALYVLLAGALVMVSLDMDGHVSRIGVRATTHDLQESAILT